MYGSVLYFFPVQNVLGPPSSQRAIPSFSFVQDMNRKYPGAGTQGPSKYAAFAYGFSYYWPNITPLSPIGNHNVSGIIAGQIHDPATP